jgi:glycogen debranching enzyme
MRLIPLYSFSATVSIGLVSSLSSLDAGISAAQSFTANATVEASEEVFSVEVRGETGGYREYRLQTTQDQRDDTPKDRVVAELPGYPRLRTGDLVFDSLFALAVDDMRLNSVSEVRDASYFGGEAIAQEVFQTGEKWHYVWTRDVSYATHLGLAAMDPKRAAESLLFKTSRFADPGLIPEDVSVLQRQVIQDTGTGGSWPVSTDRVSWAWAAEAILDALPPDARGIFAVEAFEVLRGTIEADRLVTYDASTGLYGGEQSFLDWRDQTYAPWIRDQTSWMSSSKALSTNVCHFQALVLASQLAAQAGEEEIARRYATWAENLAETINERFWNADENLYASILEPSETGRKIYRFDLLGNALVILSGIAPEERAHAVLGHYPHGPFGAPVYHPQQPDYRVYHNRAMWPFVTAFALEAAHQTRHVAHADAAMNTLIRGAALNLSNMENFEWLTGLPFFDDGPAINSRRQLWSVGGYLSMVLKTTFGLHLTADGLHLDPFLTSRLRERFGDSEEVTLHGFRYRGKRIDVRLELPHKEPAQGYFPLAAILLNGVAVGPSIRFSELEEFGTNVITVFFDPLVETGDSIEQLPMVPLRDRRDARVFAPECPVLEWEIGERGGQLVLKDSLNDPENTRYELFCDERSLGRMEAPGVFTVPVDDAYRSRRYSAEAIFRSSGYRSHPSAPLRVEGEGYRFIPIGDSRFELSGGKLDADRQALRNWGDPGDDLRVRFSISRAGRYAFRFRYNNHSDKVSSGVTCGVKLAELSSLDDAWSKNGALQFPIVEQKDGVHPWRESTALTFELEVGNYALSLRDFFNMSYLEANSAYVGTRGPNEPKNRFDLTGLSIIPLVSEPTANE